MEQSAIVVSSPADSRNSEDEQNSNKSSKGDKFFSTSPPSHIGTGLVRGVGNVAKGVVVGAAHLVMNPVVGAINGGVGGAMRGVGFGVAAAVALPFMGVVTGVQQVGLGAMNTPAAVNETGKGKVYDQASGCWVIKYKPLDDEFEHAKAEFERLSDKESSNADKKLPTHQNKASSEFGSAVVADMSYYNTLEVPSTATQGEIRKAYYRLAKQNHPDKVQDDADREAATIKFQEIGEAYQVLCEETRRAQYDRYGKEASEKMTFMDSSLFFAILFGSMAMEAYIGKLKLASMIEYDMLDESMDLNLEPDSRLQKFREIDLAIKIRQRLASAVSALMKGDEQAYGLWRASAEQTARDLCKASFGAAMLNSVGFSYQNYADQFIGSRDTFLSVGGQVAKAQHHKRKISNYWNAFISANRANSARIKADTFRKQQTDEKDALSEEIIKSMEDTVKHLVNTMLHYCHVDITTSVRNACRKYLNDPSVSVAEQKCRARALKACGKVFEEISQKWILSNGDDNVRENLEAAFMQMAEKMDEQQNPSPQE